MWMAGAACGGTSPRTLRGEDSGSVLGGEREGLVEGFGSAASGAGDRALAAGSAADRTCGRDEDVAGVRAGVVEAAGDGGGQEGLAVVLGAEDDDGVIGVEEAGGVLGERSELVRAEAGHLFGDDPTADDRAGGGGELLGAVLQLGLAEAAEFSFGGGEGVEALAEGVGGVLGAGAEEGGEFFEEATFGVVVVEGVAAGEGFDAAEVGADGGFADDADRARVGAVADVGAAAELAGEVADVDDADVVAVLLAEHHRSGMPRRRSITAEASESSCSEPSMQSSPNCSAK